jgi:hypothetical protein
MVGGADRSRTRNPLRAKQALSQLSYSPILTYTQNTYSCLRSQGIRPKWRQTTILGHHTLYSVPQSISSCVGRFQGVSQAAVPISGEKVHCHSSVVRVLGTGFEPV